jgi:hypothetical protein
MTDCCCTYSQGLALSDFDGLPPALDGLSARGRLPTSAFLAALEQSVSMPPPFSSPGILGRIAERHSAQSLFVDHLFPASEASLQLEAIGEGPGASSTVTSDGLVWHRRLNGPDAVPGAVLFEGECSCHTCREHNRGDQIYYGCPVFSISESLVHILSNPCGRANLPTRPRGRC